MKLSKLFLITGTAIALTGCTLGEPEGRDATLYHLELTYSDNVNFEQSKLTAKFAFGERHDITSRTQDEIDELLESGATQDDINKTNVRQNDGSYYYFDADPIILTAPQQEEAPGYKFNGFYEKGNNELLYNPKVTKHQLDDGSTAMLMNRWNMPDKDIILEARYEELQYKVNYVYFDGEQVTQTIANGEIYKPLRDGEVILKDAVAPKGTKFAGWYYEKSNPEEETKTQVFCTKLPNYYDETIIDNAINGYELTLFAKFEYDQYSIDFSYSLQTDQTPESIGRDTVINKMQFTGNRTKIDDEWIDLDTNRYGVEINDGNDIKMEADSWANIFIYVKEGFKPWKYSINSGSYISIYQSVALEGCYEIALNKGDITKDSTIEILFVLDI